LPVTNHEPGPGLKDGVRTPDGRRRHGLSVQHRESASSVSLVHRAQAVQSSSAAPSETVSRTSVSHWNHMVSPPNGGETRDQQQSESRQGEGACVVFGQCRVSVAMLRLRIANRPGIAPMEGQRRVDRAPSPHRRANDRLVVQSHSGCTRRQMTWGSGKRLISPRA